MPEDASTPGLRLKQRGPNANFDLYDTPDKEVVYADGISGVAFGPALARIELFRVLNITDPPAPNERPIEIREGHVTIVIPMHQLIEFCVSAINGYKANADALAVAGEAQKTELHRLIAQIK